MNWTSASTFWGWNDRGRCTWRWQSLANLTVGPVLYIKTINQFPYREYLVQLWTMLHWPKMGGVSRSRGSPMHGWGFSFLHGQKFLIFRAMMHFFAWFWHVEKRDRKSYCRFQVLWFMTFLRLLSTATSARGALSAVEIPTPPLWAEGTGDQHFKQEFAATRGPGNGSGSSCQDGVTLSLLHFHPTQPPGVESLLSLRGSSGKWNPPLFLDPSSCTGELDAEAEGAGCISWNAS